MSYAGLCDTFSQYNPSAKEKATPAGPLEGLLRGAMRAPTSKTLDALTTSFSEECVRYARAWVDEKKCDRHELTKRLFLETQGSYGRPGAPFYETAATVELGRLLSGSFPIHETILVRENLREFCMQHPEREKILAPIIETVEGAYEIELAKRVKRTLQPEWIVRNSRGTYGAPTENGCTKRINDLTSAKLQNMKPDSSLFIPGIGTISHSVSLELRKAQDNTFSCLVYNTGNGVDAHASRQCSNGHGAQFEKYHPLTWTKIPSCQLDNRFFLEILSSQESVSAELPISKMNMEEFIGRLRWLFGTEDKEAALLERAYHEQGKLPSCSHKSWSVWLHGAMDAQDPSGNLYRAFKHETTKCLIQRFDAAFPECAEDSDDSEDSNSSIDETAKRPLDSLLNLEQLQGLRRRAGNVLARRAGRHFS